jgi:two-component system, OmpR family, sensor histidine kinase VicK
LLQVKAITGIFINILYCKGLINYWLSNSRSYSEEKTEVLYDQNEIVRRVVEQCYAIKFTMDSCTDVNGPSIFVIPNHPVTKACIDMKDRGVKMRFITEITNDNLKYCKELMKIAEVRHLDEVKGNFGVGDKRVYHGGADNIKSGPPPQLIISTVKSFVEQQQYFFDMIWKKAIPAEQKIMEIEEGIEPQVIETVKDLIEIQKISNDIIKSAKKEILTIFSSAKAFYRQDKAGTVDLLKQTAVHNPDLKIRILTPINDLIKEEEGTIHKIWGGKTQQVQEKNVDIRHIEPSMQTRVTILLIDRRFSLIVELKEDSKDNSNEAIGLATYSNSKPTVLSYASIFESLWMQTELYQQIKEANEHLKIHDKMQKEFINIAAHELRGPIQPILGLTEILKNKATDKEQQELQDAVYRSARKLKQLTEDVLDVTRIESQTLQLHKERFNLSEMILNVISDSKNQVKKEYKDTIKLELVSNEDIFIDADRSRLNQVISNLLNNAIKFTDKQGAIVTTVEKKKKDGGHNVIVNVKDTGVGISQEILPRLFTKFATKSETGGTGLGLFISKSIVEAHGGRIWAKNNSDGRGSTFTFSLPLSNEQQQQEQQLSSPLLLQI